MAGRPSQKELKTIATLVSQTPLISQAGKLPAWSWLGKCTVEGTPGKCEQGEGWAGKSLLALRLVYFVTLNNINRTTLTGHLLPMCQGISQKYSHLILTSTLPLRHHCFHCIDDKTEALWINDKGNDRGQSQDGNPHSANPSHFLTLLLNTFQSLSASIYPLTRARKKGKRT